jgi:hypothetical protein
MALRPTKRHVSGRQHSLELTVVRPFLCHSRVYLVSILVHFKSVV